MSRNETFHASSNDNEDRLPQEALYNDDWVDLDQTGLDLFNFEEDNECEPRQNVVQNVDPSWICYERPWPENPHQKPERIGRRRKGIEASKKVTGEQRQVHQRTFYAASANIRLD